MPWHEQRETIEMLYAHGFLGPILGTDGDSDNLDELGEAGFGVRRIGAG